MCLHRSISRVYIPCDVTFDENVFPFEMQALISSQPPQTTHHPTILPSLRKSLVSSELSLLNNSN